jgi:hypothetical protein
MQDEEPVDPDRSRQAVEEAEFFALLSFDTVESAPGGHHERLYEFLRRSCLLVMFS